MSARDWFIAWIADETVAWDPVAHKRRDLDWTEISLTDAEGSDATSVSITTARVPSSELRGRRWAFLTFEHPDGTLYPVARMKRRRRMSLSRDGELVVDFDAGLLSTWKDLRDAGLLGLKKLIGFHPILVSSRRQNDPTEILDGHRRIGHFDRVTGAYSLPELLGEGLPMRTFGPNDWIGWDSGGGIQIGENGQMLRGVQVTCTASWLQLIQGLLDLSAAIRNLFPELNVGPASDPKSLFGGFDPSVVIAKGRVSTLTPDEFERGFPQLNTGIGGGSGYTVVKSVLKRVDPRTFADGAQPRSVGPVNGTKGKYVYVRKEGDAKPDPQDAYAINLDVTYYDVELVLAYVGRQKREETVSFLVLNAACTDPDAPIRAMDMRTEDPSIDQTTVPWLPRTHYGPGDVRRYGWNCWTSKRDHVSSGSFAADVRAGLWTIALANQSYIGGPSGDTFWHTPSGLNALYTVVLKATKPIALSQRRQTYEWSVPFEDVVADGVSTAWKARIEADDIDLPGGFAEGKIVSFTIRDSAGPGGYAKATIRIAACDGTGLAGGTGPTSVGYTDQAWDRVAIGEFSGYPPPASPVAGGEAYLQNSVADQLAYVRANDYQRGVAGRNDASANDPKQALRQVPTKFIFALNAIAGQSSLQGFIPLAVSAFQGPRQCNPPSLDA